MRALILALPLLTACVLHAKAPLFPEAAAVPLLGDKPVTFAVYDLKDGAWVANADPTVTLQPVGRHYEMPDPSQDDPARVDSYAFVPLPDGLFVVQMVTGGEADYGIASWTGSELRASPLDCARLKTSLKTNDLVTFGNGDCALSDVSPPPAAAFAMLAPRAGPPTLRFVRR